MIIFFRIVTSFFLIDENSGLYITTLNNVFTLTDDINRATDLIPTTDGCGVHYLFQDKGSGLVLDVIDGVAQLANYAGLERQRFSLLFDVKGKFQLSKGDYYFVRNQDKFVWTEGLCGTEYKNGFLLINSRKSYTLPALDLPEIGMESLMGTTQAAKLGLL
ncbi:hypothetical protein H311_01551 [Anncaliia algerae PRA109]|nr:hypothetical protein H311_01551 [Anncaliia algerae PRA109]